MAGDDPFGDRDPEEKPAGYSILRGSGPDDDDSEEAQGARASWHLRRIRQAHKLALTKRGVLTAEVEALENELAAARKQLARLDQWEADQCNVDRAMLATWLTEAPQFHDPGRPRAKTLAFTGGIAVQSQRKTVADKIIVTDEAALMRRFTGYVRQKATLLWGDLKKELRVAGNVVTDENDEPVEGVSVLPGSTTEQFFAVVDGHRVPLTGGGIDDGSGDDTDGDGAGADWDPFGDDTDDAGPRFDI